MIASKLCLERKCALTFVMDLKIAPYVHLRAKSLRRFPTTASFRIRTSST